MSNKKLISMTDFVLLQYEESSNQNEFEDKCFKYATFLKRPLELGMFVPCDEDSNVLEQCDEICSCECDKIKEYRKAKEKVLFENCTFKEETKYTYFLLEEGVYTHALNKIRPRTIESLVGMDKLTLTESAIKQLGL